MDQLTYDATIDRLADKLAKAIALAEGFYAADSLPSRINNPGDLELGDRGFGTHNKKTGYAKADIAGDIADKTDGFSALRRECRAILTGASSIYHVNFTFAAIALKWTGNDNPGAWCKIVTEKLNLNPMTTIVDWVKGEVDNNELT
jgi:hypothetical protein